MSKECGPQRACERVGWVRWAYIDYVGNAFRTYQIASDRDAVNAALNSTIIIDRMLRDGRSKWRNNLMLRLRGRMNPGSKP